jgi:LysR family transcriptional regulator (chromosome initiation inhibitor)
VNVDGQQLAALAAVIELGSFDAAAERLDVTPSAVSQRIKALEQRVGQVLVVREKPCTATAAGVPLLRLAAQTALLESEALAEMGGSKGTAARIAVAVNADSMATWFTGVFSELDGVLFDIRIEDQDHSARLLREGVVMGAVTTERTPVPGCRVQSLGVMRYIPVSSKSYIKRYLPDGFTAHAVSEAPSLAWNRDDALQDELVRKAFRRHITRPQHFVPTAEGFGAAVRAGLGWGMFPDSLVAPHLRGGSFVRVSDVHLDVPLFWQCWKLNSPLVKTVTDAVGTAAVDLRRVGANEQQFAARPKFSSSATATK